MGFLTPSPLPVEPAEFAALSHRERVRALTADWVSNGFGVQKIVHVVYILKVGIVYALGGVLIVSLTSNVGSLLEFGRWWNEPIVYQKLILWTVLIEVLGCGGAWGPLCGHFKPFTGGWRYWLRPGTIRMAPWPGKVPLTGGDIRTVFDVLLYAAILAALVTALVLPGVQTDAIRAALPHNTGGVVRPVLFAPVIALLVVTGLRDKVIFLAARGEQYLPALVFMATLPFVDMIIALKLLIVVVWVGAGFSKVGEHFINVIPPMVGNAPFVPKLVKRAHFRNPPTDLLPSKVSWFMAHVGGTVTEIIVPLTLLFASNRWVVLACIAYMVIFHAFIASTFPLAVPLEWNVIFGFAAVYLFWGYPAWDGYELLDFSNAGLLALIAAGLVFFPALGNVRPDLVSFLPSMRQYAGNWASGMWALAPGAEAKFNRVRRSAANTVDQLVAFGFEPETAEAMLYRALAWRAMHSQGRGLYSVLYTHLDEPERYTFREGEIACSTFLGWNFGDGHLHDERLIAAIQKQAQFEPGEFVAVFVESEAYGRGRGHQEYRVIDAALGVVERGTWRVHDCVKEQPWLPNGPVPLNITWTAPGYVRGGLRGSAA
ncbi:MAG TPA: DUF3556 domain-containing protein [Aeromicrobium sp.]|nr:DUF3556 domain-containing protein [Aeromicrobium sp.]